MADAVTDNKAKNRYELPIDGTIAIAAYERRGDAIAFVHTMVPERLRGQGVAARLVKAALADVRQRGLKVIADCPYVADYIARHPQEQDLLED